MPQLAISSLCNSWDPTWAKIGVQVVLFPLVPACDLGKPPKMDQSLGNLPQLRRWRGGKVK